MALEETNDLGRAGAGLKNNSALALYEGTRESDLVDEEIDERILRLLGLEDVFDIDYSTYMTLLREKMAEGRMVDNKLSTDETMLLTDEFRRVKGKVGRFKLKKRKITSEDIGATGPIRVSSNKFLLAGKAVIPEPQEADDSSDDIKGIEKALDSILKTLTLQNKDKKKQSEDERKKSEDRRRRQREGDLEKPLTQLKALAKKIIAPAQGILDRIFRFIKFTLLGYAFNQFIKWFSDPKNADKIKVLGRFLKDWWPSLLAAYALFATPFGKFIRSTLKMLRGVIPQMAKFVIKHPFLAASAAAGVGAYVMTQRNEAYRDELKKTEPSIVTPKETKETGKTPGVPQLQQEQVLQRGFGGMFNGGGLIKRRSFFGGEEISKELNVNQIAFEGGGGINDDSGLRITGAGPDTQLIAAAPGEIVMSKKAVDRYGANFFLDLNKRAGGTNIPKMVNNIQLAAGGGLIRKTIKSFQGGGMIGGFMRMPSLSLGGRSKSFAMPRLQMSSGESLNYSGQKSLQNETTKRSNTRGFFGSLIPKISGNIGNINSSSMKPSLSNETYRMSEFNMPQPKSDYSNRGMSTSQFRQMPIPINQIISSYENVSQRPVSIANLGPQNRSVVPGPPVIISKTTYTVLPPIKSPRKEQSIARGSKLPEFSISSTNDSRSKIASVLGIADLVGV